MVRNPGRATAGEGRSAPSLVHGLAVVAFAAVVSGACSNEQTPLPGRPCVVNSDCNAPLVCTYGLCHEACRANGDCPTDQRCVWSAGTNADAGARLRVCLLPDKASCALNSQCTPDLVCGRDLQCRNECKENRDCADEQDRCVVAGRNGERLCVDTDAIISRTFFDGAIPAQDSGHAESGADLSVEGGAQADGTTSDARSAPPAEEVEPNDAREAAKAYLAGTKVRGCICKADDVDWYAFSVPAEDAAGGYFTLAITEVGNGAISLRLHVASDNGLLLTNQTLVRGQSRHVYWAGAPGQTYRLEVTRTGLKPFEPFNYTLSAEYVKVNDPFEPNDNRDQPAAITLGASVAPYYYTGWRRGAIAANEYEDWFSLPLGMKPTTIALEDVPATARLRFRVYDDTFSEIKATNNAGSGPGAEVHGSFSALKEGTYRLVVDSLLRLPVPAEAAEAVPEHFTKPYRLTVTQ